MFYLLIDSDYSYGEVIEYFPTSDLLEVEVKYSIQDVQNLETRLISSYAYVTIAWF